MLSITSVSICLLTTLGQRGEKHLNVAGIEARPSCTVNDQSFINSTAHWLDQYAAIDHEASFC